MKTVVSLLSAAAWLVIAAMVLFNPSGTLPMRGASTGFFAVFIGISAGAAFFLPLLAMSASGPAIQFFFRFGAGFILLMAFAWYAFFVFHRDFSVYATQLVVLYLTIFFLNLNKLKIIHRKATVYKTLFFSAALIFILWIIWLIMMAYAIVSRVEPRWIEASGYNIVNGVIGLVMLVSAGMLHEQAKHRVYTGGSDIYLDDRKISDYLSPQENRILWAFLHTPHHTHTCSSLIRYLRDSDYTDEKKLPDCRQCMEDHWKPSSCPVYRNLKNRIGDTKKYLELLQIGTIVPVSENSREIKDKGWKLRFFDDVSSPIFKGRPTRSRLFADYHN